MMEEHSSHGEHHGGEHHGGEHHAHHAPHHASHAEGMKMPKMDFKHSDIKGGFSKFLEIVKLNKTVMMDVANDEKMNSTAAIFLILGELVTPLGFWLWSLFFGAQAAVGALVFLIISVVVNLAVEVAGIYLVSLVSMKLFKGHANFGQLFRVVGLASLLEAALVVGAFVPLLLPLLGLAVGIWMFVILYTILSTVAKMDATNTVLTIIVSAIGIWIIGMVVFAILGSLALGGAMMGGGFGGLGGMYGGGMMFRY